MDASSIKSKVLLKASRFDEGDARCAIVAEMLMLYPDIPERISGKQSIELILKLMGFQHAKDQVILSSVLDELEKCRKALKRAAYETVCYDISGHRKDICVEALAALENFQERIGK